MKKILFVESRYMTYLYDKIAEKLIDDGYEVSWLVLNHEFNPQFGQKFLIEYPTRRDKSSHKSSYLQTIIETDRQLRFFNKKDVNHFYYYDLKIRDVINFIKPDVVFGEPTLFHHLIAIEICKELNILYLFPASCRYPVDRIAFYMFETLKPFKGSNEILDEYDAQEVIKNIVNRTCVPNYMVARKVTFWNKLQDKIKILRGYIKGERYNTPPPLEKLRSNIQNKAFLKEWNNISVNTVDKSKFVVLFPLHMQPESSIDVWGRNYSDQTKVIEDIIQQLGENQVLYVKPNPKSSFEINRKLIEIVKANDNIFALEDTVKMGDIFDSVDLFITVVGTIAIECILSDKPVISLVETYFNNTLGSYTMSSTQEIRHIIELIQREEFHPLDIKEKVNYINNLNSRSYSGVLGDPGKNKYTVSDENIDRLHKAFIDVLGGL